MNNIRELRKRLGVHQYELASAIGVSVPAVSNWESGKTKPTDENITKLAEFFGVDESAIRNNEDVNDNLDLSNVEHVVQYVLEKSGTMKLYESVPKTEESTLIVRAVDKMPQDDREKVLNMMRAVYSEYFDKAEDKIG